MRKYLGRDLLTKMKLNEREHRHLFTLVGNKIFKDVEEMKDDIYQYIVENITDPELIKEAKQIRQRDLER